MHARAANRFQNIEHLFAINKHIKDRRHLAQVLGVGAVKQQVTGKTVEFTDHHADYLSTLRNFDSGQLLHGKHIRQIVHRTAQIIDPVRIRDVSVPGLSFAHLFRASMVITDVGQRINNLFAIQLQGNTKCAMYAGMIGSHIQEHEIAVFTVPPHTPIFGHETQGILFDFLKFVGKAKRLHFRSAGIMVLAQRMSLPGRRHDDALEMRMAFKDDAEHIPYFALVPIGRGPNITDSREGKAGFDQRNFETNILVAAKREQMIDNGKVAFGKAMPVGALALIDGRQVEQQCIGGIGLHF